VSLTRLPIETPAVDVSVAALERAELSEGTKKRAPRWRHPVLRYGIAFAATAVVVVLLVIPQFRKAGQDLPLLGRISLGWILLGVGLEVISFMAYGLFTRSVMPAEGRPRYHRLLRIDVVGSGLSHTLPGGGTVASGVRYRLLLNAGVKGTDAAFGSVIQGIGSGVVINAMLIAGLLFARPSKGEGLLYLGGVAFAAVHIALIVGIWIGLLRSEERTVRLARRLAARWGRADAAEDVVRRIAARSREFGTNPMLLVRAVAWSAANWLFDLASLWVFVRGFGYHVNLPEMFLAFGLAHNIGMLPISPGGVGVVEGVLIPLLVASGTPAGVALLGVLSWRLISFWAPIPLGALCWATLCRRPRWWPGQPKLTTSWDAPVRSLR
jgi:uncharacterized membrane protein YbhN (UPF0104 family)